MAGERSGHRRRAVLPEQSRRFLAGGGLQGKNVGRFRKDYQLAFVDGGLMPLVEEEVGENLGRLIERNVSGLKT